MEFLWLFDKCFELPAVLVKRRNIKDISAKAIHVPEQLRARFISCGASRRRWGGTEGVKVWLLLGIQENSLFSVADWPLYQASLKIFFNPLLFFKSPHHLCIDCSSAMCRIPFTGPSKIWNNHVSKYQTAIN